MSKMVFGYLYGKHTIRRAGRLLSEDVENVDGQKVLVKKFELIEQEVLCEQPWMMATQAGQVHVCVPSPLTSEIEKLAPPGFEVIWREEVIKRRGRRRKMVPVEAPANAIENGKVENAVIVDNPDDDDYDEEEFVTI